MIDFIAHARTRAAPRRGKYRILIALSESTKDKQSKTKTIKTLETKGKIGHQTRHHHSPLEVPQNYFAAE